MLALGVLEAWGEGLPECSQIVIKEIRIFDLDGNPLENVDLIADPASNIVVLVNAGKICKNAFKESLRRGRVRV